MRPHLLLAALVIFPSTAHAQNWTNPAVDQATLKALPPLGSLILPPLPPPPQKRAVLINGAIEVADFPDAAIRGGEEGTVLIRFVIDPKGQVASCTTATDAALPLLSATTCAIVKQRFKFTPAQDAKGKPVSEIRQTRVTWRMPDSVATVPIFPIVIAAQGQGLRVALQLLIDPRGRVGQCRIATIEHPAIAYQADICATLARTMTFPVKKDASGKATGYAQDHVLWVAETVPSIEEETR